jgi:hypothetical protein
VEVGVAEDDDYSPSVQSRRLRALLEDNALRARKTRAERRRHLAGGHRRGRRELDHDLRPARRVAVDQ